MTIVIETKWDGWLPYRKTTKKLNAGTKIQFNYVIWPDDEVKSFRELKNPDVTILNNSAMVVKINGNVQIVREEQINNPYWENTEFVRSYLLVFKFRSSFRYIP